MICEPFDGSFVFRFEVDFGVVGVRDDELAGLDEEDADEDWDAWVPFAGAGAGAGAFVPEVIGACGSDCSDESHLGGEGEGDANGDWGWGTRARVDVDAPFWDRLDVNGVGEEADQWARFPCGVADFHYISPGKDGRAWFGVEEVVIILRAWDDDRGWLWFGTGGFC